MISFSAKFLISRRRIRLIFHNAVPCTCRKIKIRKKIIWNAKQNIWLTMFYLIAESLLIAISQLVSILLENKSCCAIKNALWQQLIFKIKFLGRKNVFKVILKIVFVPSLSFKKSIPTCCVSFRFVLLIKHLVFIWI